MSYNYQKLRGKIVEVYETQEAFAAAMSMSTRTMSLKMNSNIDWKQEEIQRACELLSIPVAKIPQYFFVPKV